MRTLINIASLLLAVLSFSAIFTLDKPVTTSIILVTLSITGAVSLWIFMLSIIFHKYNIFFFVEKQKFKVGDEVVYTDSDYFGLKHGKKYTIKSVYITHCCKKYLYDLGVSKPNDNHLYSNSCSCTNEHLNKFILTNTETLEKYTEELSFSENVKLSVLMQQSKSKPSEKSTDE